MSPFTIAIANQQRAVRINRRQLTRLARSVLARETVASADISIAIVDDRQIHAINRQFLKHDYPTDVISFLLDGAFEETSACGRAGRVGAKPTGKGRGRGRALRTNRRGRGKVIDGEVILSAETARRNAGIFGVSPNEELSLYLVHGLLHLCGYDDMTRPEKQLMRRREAESLGRTATRRT